MEKNKQDLEQSNDLLGTITLVYHEIVCERYEKKLKRQFNIFMITIGLILGAVFGGMYYVLDTYEFSTYEQSGDGMFNVNTGEQGDLSYGPED